MVTLAKFDGQNKVKIHCRQLMVTDVLCFRSLRRSLITLESTGCWVRTGEGSPEHTLCTSMFSTVLTNIFLSFAEWWYWKANRRRTLQLKVICTSSRATRTATDNTHYIMHATKYMYLRLIHLIFIYEATEQNTTETKHSKTVEIKHYRF